MDMKSTLNPCIWVVERSEVGKANLIIPMMMIIKIGLGETNKGPLVVINMTILNIVHLIFMKKNHNFLITSFFSPTHNRKKICFYQPINL
jgi:hypothetical protein